MTLRPAEHHLDVPNTDALAASPAPAPTLSVVTGAGAGSLGVEERALVTGLQAGDVAAFERIFREHSAAMFAYAMRVLGAREDAEDVVQSVFRAVWERRATWQPTAGVRPYLIASTRNAALNVARHVRRAELVEARLVDDGVRAGMGAAPAPIDAALEAADEAERIEAVARELAPRCRAVFLRRWRQGLTVAETARALGITPKTVEMQWTRALARIRERMARIR
jgi:RNA polymerase sigma factor (sigma-70 family)